MTTDFRLRLQLDEALGSINRWFCSEYYGREIDDHELLVEYYVKSGGACDFARRFNEAMGKENRWYCSQFYRRDIRNPEILWDYYMNHAPAGAVGRDRRSEPKTVESELSVAC
ncbi:MAG: hypothetical protein ABSF29_08110 [Tepidisphaeraceae bacterium]